MTKQEHDIIVTMEECGEIIQECGNLIQTLSKTMRFGLDNHNPATPEITNANTLVTEYYQMCAMMDMLLERYDIVPDPMKISEIRLEKLRKVSQYTQLSENIGRITDETTILRGGI